MIAEKNLAQILAAADKADEEDVAIRAALHIALCGIKAFAAFAAIRVEDPPFPNATPKTSNILRL
jgi:hypothetical protein